MPSTEEQVGKSRFEYFHAKVIVKFYVVEHNKNHYVIPVGASAHTSGRPRLKTTAQPPLLRSRRLEQFSIERRKQSDNYFGFSFTTV